MKIKICDKNKDLIENKLAKVNGTATSHCYTTYNEILNIVKIAEYKLNKLNLSISYRNNAYLHSISGKTVPNAYRYTRIATKVIIKYSNKYWYIVDIFRDIINKQGGYDRLYLTQTQSDIVINKFKSQYSIYKDNTKSNEVNDNINIIGL